jgi:SNF2 family DNA or RNA helicase
MTQAVDAFIARARLDYRQALTWDTAEIEDAVASLPVPPPIFHDRLRRSQQICVVIGAHKRRFAFYNDMGTGKSLIGMALAAYFAAAEDAGPFIVLVPNRVNIRGWLDQVRKHAPEIKAVAMPSNMADKRELLATTDALLVIETYAGFSRMCSEKIGKKLIPNSTTMLAVGQQIGGLIVDESSAIGNYKSLQTEVVRRLAEQNEDLCVFLLSGTPFGRDPHLLWPQMHILDGGWTLGKTLGIFRATFFNTTINNWGGYEYEFKQKQTKLLHRCIAHRSIRFALDQADLPAVTPVRIDLNLAAEASELYDAALAQMRAARGNYELCKNAFIRLRQISSGFVNLKDPETGAREQIEFKDNPKLEWIRSQLGAMDGQIILFHDFIYSGTMLKRTLDEMAVSNCIINGQITGKEMDKAYDDFTRGRKQVLLLNSAAGAYGVNLQMARYGIYYESPVPVIIRKQTELRFIRPGSEHQKVVKVDLVVSGTVDEAILQFHVEGADLFKAILDGSFKL